MTYRLELNVDELPRCNPANIHWRVKADDRTRWGRLMRAALGRSPKPSQPLERALVVLTRRSSSQPDGDNLVASFKLALDLLMPPGTPNKRGNLQNRGGLSIIVDDSPRHLEAEYRWELAPPKQGSVTITVEERPSE